MTYRTRFLLTCATSALLVGGGAISGARAADANLVKAPPPAADSSPWWFQGYLDVGGRGFVNDPSRGNTYPGNSLAKYYEYSTVAPGPFGDGWVAAGSKDGVYEVDVWAKNVGYTDQNYQATLQKAGEQYLTLGWDETPHIYSMSAQTIYNGVGSNSLTLPPNLSNTLATLAGNTSPVSNPALVRQQINLAEHPTDIGIRRDTASAEYRYAPMDSAWDIRLNYSHMHREGTQVDGVVASSTSSVVSQVPKPVNDTTQNYGASGEYVGVSPWDRKFSLKVAYSGSTYTDQDPSYTVQNPFCLTGATTCDRTSAPLAQVSLPPDNMANAVSSTFAADLPFESRYMGTASYNMMRQNQAFLPFTINTGPINGGAIANGLPASSLNGEINTLLVNNVLTTQITPNLKSKLTYRYYDYDNQTPQLYFGNWIINDILNAQVHDNGYAPVTALQMGYVKQNAGEELNWRPNREWNLGVAYGYERYDWTRESANSTAENSVKGYADWKPVTWVDARASYSFGDRQQGVYDYTDNVGNIQWPGTITGGAHGCAPSGVWNGCDTAIAGAYRSFYLDNRQRSKMNFQVGVDVLSGLTVTPSFTLQNDNYNLASTEEGMTYDHSYHAGVEVAYAMNPSTRWLLAYMYEAYNKGIINGTIGAATTAASQLAYVNVQDSVKTLMFGVDQVVIPNKLDVKLTYTLSTSLDHQPVPYTIASTAALAFGNYPDVTGQFQRLDAVARYYFDDDFVRQLGWKGKISAQLHYAWERNSVNNWQNDEMSTYMYAANVNTSVGYMTWLNYDNPNYNVQMLMGSIRLAW